MIDSQKVHLAIAQLLGLPRLRQQIDTLPADSHWQTLAKAALADDLAGLQRAISLQALAAADVAAADVVAAWHAANGDSVDRAQRLLAELGDAVAADLAMLSVALREVQTQLRVASWGAVRRVAPTASTLQGMIARRQPHRRRVS